MWTCETCQGQWVLSNAAGLEAECLIFWGAKKRKIRGVAKTYRLSRKEQGAGIFGAIYTGHLFQRKITLDLQGLEDPDPGFFYFKKFRI